MTDQNSVGEQLARRVVVEGVAPKAPKGSSGKPKGSGGTGEGESFSPGNVDPNSIPGNPNRVPGKSGDTSHEGAIPGRPQEDTVPSQPKEDAILGQPKEDSVPAGDKGDEGTKPKEDGQAEENRKSNCKRGLQGRADCSDTEMGYYEKESSQPASEESNGPLTDKDGFPLSDNDAPTPETAAMLKPYNEKTYRDNGEQSQKYLTGEEAAHAPNWPPYHNTYRDAIPPQMKNTNPVGGKSTDTTKGAAEVLDRFGIKYDTSVTDWTKASMKSTNPDRQLATNSAWYSPSQKTITIDSMRADFDGNARGSPGHLPASELNKQVYGEKSGTDGAGFKWVVQPRVAGKGSVKAIKELWKRNNWSPNEWHSFDFSNLKPGSRAPINKNSDQTLISGIDNVRTFEAMAGTYGKTIKEVHIQGVNEYTTEPAMVIEFAV